MEKKKVYLSGPISGFFLEERISTFQDVSYLLKMLGHQPVNPFDNGLPTGAAYKDHMKADIKMLLDCDAILMLLDWQQSAGAQLELRVAMACGLELLQVEIDLDTDKYSVNKLNDATALNFLRGEL